jgi:hypothetical protein
MEYPYDNSYLEQSFVDYNMESLDNGNDMLNELMGEAIDFGEVSQAQGWGQSHRQGQGLGSHHHNAHLRFAGREGHDWSSSDYSHSPTLVPGEHESEAFCSDEEESMFREDDDYEDDETYDSYSYDQELVEDSSHYHHTSRSRTDHVIATDTDTDQNMANLLFGSNTMVGLNLLVSGYEDEDPSTDNDNSVAVPVWANHVRS